MVKIIKFKIFEKLLFYLVELEFIELLYLLLLWLIPFILFFNCFTVF